MPFEPRPNVRQYAGQHMDPIHLNFPGLTSVVNQAFHEGLFSQIHIGWVAPFGRNTLSMDKNKVAIKDPIIDLTSVTKYVLSLLTHILCHRPDDVRTIPGFDLDRRVCTLINFHGPNSDYLTVGHLLRFLVEFNESEHLSKLVLDKGYDYDALVRGISGKGLARVPGKVWFYANHASFLLGHILTELTGKPLDVLMDNLIFAPLSMFETTFFPKRRWTSAELIQRCVPTSPPGQFAPGVHNDPCARVFLENKIAIGSAGLFSTLGDMMKLSALILDQGFNAAARRKFLPCGVIKSLGQISTPEDCTYRDGSPVAFGNGAGLWDILRQGNEDVSTKSPGGSFKIGHSRVITINLPFHRTGIFIATDGLAMEPLTLSKRTYRVFVQIASIIAEAIEAEWNSRIEVHKWAEHVPDSKVGLGENEEW